MARTVEQIKNTILAAKENESSLDGLNSISKTSIWRLFIYIIAVAINVLETLFDTHKKEVSDLLANQKRGSKLWYRNMALAFQYGFELIKNTDQFNNKNYTDDQVASSKIIKYAAVTESAYESRIIVKIATESGDGILTPIGETEKIAFNSYFDEINYAGVKYTILNYSPDRLKLNLTIKIDPKVINLSGTKILMSATDVGTKPIEAAISEFMKELPFDGKLILNALIDKLQAIEGVINPVLNTASTSWINAGSNGYGDMKDIYAEVLPMAGYFTWSLEDNEFKSVINYVV